MQPIARYKTARQRELTGSIQLSKHMDNSSNLQLSNLQAAIAYALAGYQVLRVYGVNTDGTCRCHGRSACKCPGKHPVGKSGVGQATTDEVRITKWFADRSDYNVGIATGAGSGIIVIDVDPRHGGFESLEELKRLLVEEQREKPACAIQITGGGGRHLIFRHPGSVIHNRIGVMPGIDVKADGGFIVVAPSQHASGGHYTWGAGCGLPESAPGELPKDWMFLLGPRKGCGGVTQSTHEYPENPREPMVLRAGHRRRRRPSLSLSEIEIESLIADTLPSARGTRHDKLWDLTRALVGIVGNDPQLHLSLVLEIVSRWYLRAQELNVTTGTHAVEECVERVLDAWDKVKCPGGEDQVEVAVRTAQKAGDHPACTRLLAPSDFTRHLVGTCAQLADDKGEFFLSCGKAAKAMTFVMQRNYEKMDVFRALRRLQKAGIIEEIAKGEARRGGKATVYRFRGDT